jgi:hypothetical protein
MGVVAMTMFIIMVRRELVQELSHAISHLENV